MAVTVDTVATTLGRELTDVERKQVQMWLDDAMLLIRLRYGDRFSELGTDALEYVVREAVALKVKAPDPATRTAVAFDDARVERQYTRASGQVSILDEWWDLLNSSLPGAGDRKAFTIRLGGGGVAW